MAYRQLLKKCERETNNWWTNKNARTKTTLQTAKKKAKKLVTPSAVYAEQEVEVVRRKRKPRDEEEI